MRTAAARRRRPTPTSSSVVNKRGRWKGASPPQRRAQYWTAALTDCAVVT